MTTNKSGVIMLMAVLLAAAAASQEQFQSSDNAEGDDILGILVF